MLCDLPFGRQHAADPPTLYPEALREAARVLRPHGRAVFLVSEEHLGLMHRICGAAEGGEGGEVGGGGGGGDSGGGGESGCGLRVLCVRAVPLGLMRAAIVVCERCAAADSDAVASAPASAAAVLATPVAPEAAAAPAKVPTRLPWETKAGRAGWDALRKRDRPPMVPAALSWGRDAGSLPGQPAPPPVEGSLAGVASMNLGPAPAAGGQ